MSFSALFNSSKMSKGAHERRAYWRTIPLVRLRFLLLAVFFTFATIGFLTSILGAGQRPVAIGFGWALVTGATSTCYVLVFARKPILFLVVVAFQMLVNTGYSRFTAVVIEHRWLPLTPERTALFILVVSAIISLVIGYGCFLAFIEREGKQAIRAQTELSMAHSIQQTLVPRLELTAAGCEIFGISVPSDKVGGDVVDVVLLADGSVAAYVADVAGHGLQAGILMGMLKTAARTRLFDDAEPAALFASLNRVMPGVKEAHMYATCAAFRLPACENGGCRELEYAVAGHPPILRVGDSGNAADYLFDEQLPLGLFLSAEYRSQSVSCRPGDLLVIATDGVLEVEDDGGEEFGAARLEALVRAESHRDLPTLAANILDSVKRFGKQTDDQTLLLIRVL
jgi:serine phosphatase RsbU (regulator of sigma subunit)